MSDSLEGIALDVTKEKLEQAVKDMEFYRMIADNDARFFNYIRELLKGTKYIVELDKVIKMFINRLGEEEEENGDIE